MKKQPKVKKSHKKTAAAPFYKQRWFLMLAGLAVFVLFVVNGMNHQSPDVLGVSTSHSLWDTIVSIFR
ncbi:hypothetical protein HYS00_02070 [Candidatus Microgenomates bacterium]|nr:hypothetical protein [Candidatus Microgenomates bacterium]